MIWLATFGPLGYYRGGGTYATIAMIPVFYFLYWLNLSLLTGGCIIVGSFFAAYGIIQAVLPLFPHEKDPSAIVLDEAVASLLIFWGVPLTLRLLLIGIILFRIFDITKPLGIATLEKLPGSWGILLDDYAAACMARLCLQLFML